MIFYLFIYLFPLNIFLVQYSERWILRARGERICKNLRKARGLESYIKFYKSLIPEPDTSLDLSPFWVRDFVCVCVHDSRRLFYEFVCVCVYIAHSKASDHWQWDRDPFYQLKNELTHSNIIIQLVNGNRLREKELFCLKIPKVP